MVFSALQIRVDSSGPRRFEEDSRFRVASRFYRSQMSGDVLEAVYLSGEPGDFLDPEVLRRLQQFEAAALELPAVDKVVSIANHIARTYWVFRGEVGDASLLPDSAKAVAQLLLLYESSGELGSIADLVTADHSMIRIMVTADVQSSSASNQLRLDLHAIAERLLPQYTTEHSVVSTEMLLSKAADVIAVEQIRSAGLALMMVLVVIAVSFGSLKAGGLVVLPNVLPIVTNLGMMVLMGIALSDATSIISATAIGIAVDSTVHLLSSIRTAERCMSSRRAAVLHTLMTTGRPVVVSSFVVVLGFSFLLLSEFGSVADLGFLTALTMVYCLIADLFVLPAQLLVSKKCRDEPDPFILNCQGRPVVASGIQNSAGEWRFAGYGDGSRTAIDLREISGVDRVGLDGRKYQPTDCTY
jgi:predicted RND superfamily exporter protein